MPGLVERRHNMLLIISIRDKTSNIFRQQIPIKLF